MPNAQEFRSRLDEYFTRASAEGLAYVDVNSGALHRELGGYPSQTNHQMPTCCSVLYSEMRAGDQLLSAPPKGKGATVTIRYQLPR